MLMRSCVRLVSGMLFCLLLAACGTHREGIADLDTYPQNATLYLAGNARQPLVKAVVQQAQYTRYVDHLFSPWQSNAATVGADSAFWGVATFGSRKGFGENLQPWSLARWKALVARQMQAGYPSMARRAIATRNTSFRVMPTDKPFFYDPAKAGEGYPFDYMQNSAVWIGTPLLVTHVSSDGAWFFAEAGITYGWLPADAFGWADEAFCKAYRTAQFVSIAHDGVPLRSSSGDYVGTAHIGTVLPVSNQRTGLVIGMNAAVEVAVSAKKSTGQPVKAPAEQSGITPAAAGDVHVLVPARTVAGNAVAVSVALSETVAPVMPQPLTAEAVVRYANGMVGQPYGWGGLLENRDCSAAMRDIFAAFGIWLPRNSSQQGQKVGTLVALDGKSPAEKRAIILEKGVPFYSLIWFKGHIGLYLGPDAKSGEPLLLHNVWGARTEWDGVEGRAIVGRMAITSLRFGEERDDVKKDWFYNRIKGLVLLPSGAATDAP